MRFLTLLAAPLLILAADRPEVPDLAPLPDDQVFALVVIDDLAKCVGKLDRLVATFNPQANPAGEASVALDRMLGDGGRGLIGAGPCVIAIGPGGMAPAVSLVLPCAQPEALVKILTAKGLAVAAVDDGVVIAPKANALALGQRFAPLRAGLASGRADVDVRFLVSPSRLVTAYEPVLRPMMTVMKARLAGQPQAAIIMPLLMAEFAGLLSVGKDLEGVQIDLAFDTDAIRSSTVLDAKADSALARALVAPKVPWPGDLARRMGLDPGYLVIIGRVDSAALCGWMADLIAGMKAEPELAEFAHDGLIDGIRSWGTFWDGTMVTRMHGSAEHPMRTEGALGITDPEAYRAAMQTFVAALLGEGPLAKIYAELGLGVTMKENARSIGEVPVTRIEYTLDETKLGADVTAQMRATMPPMEFALPTGCAVYAQDPETLDRLVTGGAEALPTTATRTIGEGRDGLWDFALITLWKDVMRTQQANPIMAPLAEVLAKLPPGEPVTGGWTCLDGRSLLEMRVPLKPIVDLVNSTRLVVERRRRPDAEAAPAPAGGAADVF